MQFERVRVGAIEWGIILLTLATASIHFVAYANDAQIPLLLNGLGYLALLVALYAPFQALAHRRVALRWGLIAYTIVTVLVWTVGGPREALAYIDKVVEVALVLLLLLDVRRSHRTPGPVRQ